eukprot:COSAG01_NODE_8869_length_2629_cov_3.546998_4_plen_246_part_00
MITAWRTCCGCSAAAGLRDGVRGWASAAAPPQRRGPAAQQRHRQHRHGAVVYPASCGSSHGLGAYSNTNICLPVASPSLFLTPPAPSSRPFNFLFRRHFVRLCLSCMPCVKLIGPSMCLSVCVCINPQTCASPECECWASLRRCYVVTPPAAALSRQSVEADMTPAAANGCNPATAWKLALQIEHPVQSAASASLELCESHGRATSAELLLPANSFLVVALPSTYIYTYASYGMAAAAAAAAAAS